MKSAKIFAIAVLAGAILMAGSTANVNGNAFGNPKAQVTMEVFSDFQCPGCKAFHDQDLPKVMADYVVPGKVYLVYRYFPLQIHPQGRVCAEFACAAARLGRYQKVSDVLFGNQQAITGGAKVEDIVKTVLTPTEMKTVLATLKAPDVQKEIETDVEEGKSIPVNFTPTIWVTSHGRSQPVSWPLNYALFKQYMDSLVAK